MTTTKEAYIDFQNAMQEYRESQEELNNLLCRAIDVSIDTQERIINPKTDE